MSKAMLEGSPPHPYGMLLRGAAVNRTGHTEKGTGYFSWQKVACPLFRAHEGECLAAILRTPGGGALDAWDP
jgi:hypothetical protein